MNSQPILQTIYEQQSIGSLSGEKVHQENSSKISILGISTIILDKIHFKEIPIESLDI